ncbi:hypothetical protein C8R43DRAFT_961858 [Mycena crocata]|nr:hypothetical protein C8R43DRAFT_961858 [Mycena crocata]
MELRRMPERKFWCFLAYLGLKIRLSPSPSPKVFNSEGRITRHLNTWSKYYSIPLVVIASAVATFPGGRAAPSGGISVLPVGGLYPPLMQDCNVVGANCVAIGHDEKTDATWAWTWTTPVRILAIETDNPCVMENFTLAQHQPPTANLALKDYGGPLWVDTDGQKFADCVAIEGDYRDMRSP